MFNTLLTFAARSVGTSRVGIATELVKVAETQVLVESAAVVPAKVALPLRVAGVVGEVLGVFAALVVSTLDSLGVNTELLQSRADLLSVSILGEARGLGGITASL